MAGKAKRAVWNETACKVHGRSNGDPGMVPAVRLSTRGTRAEKQGKIGCPMYNREKAQQS